MNGLIAALIGYLCGCGCTGWTAPSSSLAGRQSLRGVDSLAQSDPRLVVVARDVVHLGALHEAHTLPQRAALGLPDVPVEVGHLLIRCNET